MLLPRCVAPGRTRGNCAPHAAQRRGRLHSGAAPPRFVPLQHTPSTPSPPPSATQPWSLLSTRPDCPRTTLPTPNPDLPLQARAVVLFSLDGEECVSTVSITHSGASSYCKAAAQMDSATAAPRDAEKRTHYTTYGPSCYRFIPLSAKTFGRLGQPFMTMLTNLASRTATHCDGAYTPTNCVTSALQELSVCLCRCNTDLERAVANCFTRVSGNLEALMHGVTHPTVQLV